MSFKFSLFSLERKQDSECVEHNKPKEDKMKKKSKKLKSHQKKFSKYSRICHKEPTKDKYYKCMSENLRKK